MMEKREVRLDNCVLFLGDLPRKILLRGTSEMHAMFCCTSTTEQALQLGAIS